MLDKKSVEINKQIKKREKWSEDRKQVWYMWQWFKSDVAVKGVWGAIKKQYYKIPEYKRWIARRKKISK